LPPQPVCDACGRNAWPPPGPGRARMPGRCDSSRRTPETALRQRPVSGLPLTKDAHAHPHALSGHETESELPSSVHERALSVSDVGYEKTLYAAKEGEECAQNT